MSCIVAILAQALPTTPMSRSRSPRRNDGSSHEEDGDDEPWVYRWSSGVELDALGCDRRTDELDQEELEAEDGGGAQRLPQTLNPEADLLMMQLARAELFWLFGPGDAAAVHCGEADVTDPPADAAAPAAEAPVAAPPAAAAPEAAAAAEDAAA